MLTGSADRRRRSAQEKLAMIGGKSEPPKTVSMVARIEWLTDKGSRYIAEQAGRLASHRGLKLMVTASVRRPHGNGVAKAS